MSGGRLAVVGGHRLIGSDLGVGAPELTVALGATPSAFPDERGLVAHHAGVVGISMAPECVVAGALVPSLAAQSS